MALRFIAILAFVFVIETSMQAEESRTGLKVGDSVDVQLAGDLAIEYRRRIRPADKTEDSTSAVVNVTATITDQLSSGRFTISHYSPVIEYADSTRLVTLFTTIDGKDVRADSDIQIGAAYVSPKQFPSDVLVAGYPNRTGRIHPSVPADQGIVEEGKRYHISLSEIKDVKLRVWELSESVGK